MLFVGTFYWRGNHQLRLVNKASECAANWFWFRRTSCAGAFCFCECTVFDDCFVLHAQRFPLEWINPAHFYCFLNPPVFGTKFVCRPVNPVVRCCCFSCSFFTVTKFRGITRGLCAIRKSTTESAVSTVLMLMLPSLLQVMIAQICKLHWSVFQRFWKFMLCIA